MSRLEDNLIRIGSLLSCESWGWNLDHQALQQAPLHTKPSHCLRGGGGSGWFFGDKVSLCDLGWLRPSYVDHVDLKLIEIYLLLPLECWS